MHPLAERRVVSRRNVDIPCILETRAVRFTETDNEFLVKRLIEVYYEAKERIAKSGKVVGWTRESEVDTEGGGRGRINRRKKLRVSDIVDKSRPVGVSRRLTENFVVASVHRTPREHFSLIRWEVPSDRLTDSTSAAVCRILVSQLPIHSGIGAKL